jgi:hypothetical protein
MDRADKIFTILSMIALVGLLVHHHRPRGHRGVLSGVKVNTPAVPSMDVGPAYLLSALPIMRRKDDYADPSSYYTVDGEPYSTAEWPH